MPVSLIKKSLSIKCYDKFIYLSIYLSLVLSIYEVHTINFQTFFCVAFKIIADS